jgi:hypothetical protein
MGNRRTAKFISALVGSVIAGAPLAAVSQTTPAATSAANAAGDCLASPKGTAPQGQHWHYRVERGTKRQCWYLRAEGSKDGATAVQTAQAATDTPAAASAPAQQRSVQDARAEFLTPPSVAAGPATAPPQAAATAPAPAQQSASPTADSNAQQPAVAARWPDASATAASPAPQPSPAPVAAAAQPGTKPSKSPAPAASAAADGSDKPTGTLQMLLLVVVGALALAGVLASIIYRFAGGRLREPASDHRVIWDDRERLDHDDGRAPWLDAEPAAAPRTRQREPVDFDEVRPQAPQITAFTAAIARAAAQVRPVDVAAEEPDETGIEFFHGEFEIEAAPRLAANDVEGAQPVDLDEKVGADADVDQNDAVDVDVITAMLERLAQQGPRWSQPSPEADPADCARSQRDQSAARA